MINYIAQQGQALQDLHGKYSGRVFILGNGPSLLGHDLNCLFKEPTWACNNWFSWMNAFVIEHYTVSYQVFTGMVSDPFNRPPSNHIRGEQFLHYIIDPMDLIEVSGWVHVQVDNLDSPPAFTEPLLTLQHGGSTPHINAQLAAWMGYTEIYMLGCEQTDGYVYDPEANRQANKSAGFYIRQKQQLFEDLAGQLYNQGVNLRDCTPDGALNEVLGYVPLEEVLG